MATMGITYDRVRVNADFIKPEQLLKIAEQEVALTIANNVDKNARGRDADGAPLKAYSSSYRDAIKRAVTRRTIARGRNAGRTVLRPRRVSEFTVAERNGEFFRQRTRTSRADPLAKKGGSTTVTLRVTGTLHQSRKAVKLPGPGVQVEGRFVGGHPAGMSNAQLAGYQIALGRDNWHAFGTFDQDRIHKRFAKEIGDAADQRLLKITKK